jgi:hypothetical protein
MGHRFSLVLSREISDEESATLQEAGCVSAVFGADTLPTNAQVPVTKMDFDDTESPSLAEAIETGAPGPQRTGGPADEVTSVTRGFS